MKWNYSLDDSQYKNYKKLMINLYNLWLFPSCIHLEIYFRLLIPTNIPGLAHKRTDNKK